MLDYGIDQDDEPTTVADPAAVITTVTPGLFTIARVYGRAAADGERQARQVLERSALRFAAAKLRKIGERGAVAWAGTLEAMADDEGAR